MIFLIDIVNNEHQVIVYESLTDLSNSVEWQDIFEGKSIILDEHGVEYEWDSSRKDEIGIVYGYTLISTYKVSKLITECLNVVKDEPDIVEFSFTL